MSIGLFFGIAIVVGIIHTAILYHFASKYFNDKSKK